MEDEMDVVDLPLVSDSLSIAEALAFLVKSGRASLVTKRNGAHTVLTAADLTKARRKHGDVKLSKLSAGSIVVPVKSDVSKEELRFHNPSVVAITGSLATAAADYGLLQVDQGRVWIVTKSEQVAAEFRAAITICRCRKNPTDHVYLPSELSKPPQCELDSEPVDC